MSNAVNNDKRFAGLGGLEQVLAQDLITAKAGGGQQATNALNAMINRVTTVASAGDSVTLPIAQPGMTITVINTTATSMNVFPNTGDAINNGAANALYALAGVHSALFSAGGSGFWGAISGA